MHLIANLLSFAALLAVIIALARAARGQDAERWLLYSWGCLCLSLFLWPH